MLQKILDKENIFLLKIAVGAGVTILPSKLMKFVRSDLRFFLRIDSFFGLFAV